MSYDVILAAIIGAIPPTIVAVRGLIMSRHIRQEIRVPERRKHEPKSAGHNGRTLGEEVHELRQDIYSLGQLFGQHIVYHGDKNYPVTLQDLEEPLRTIVSDSERERQSRRGDTEPWR